MIDIFKDKYIIYSVNEIFCYYYNFIDYTKALNKPSFNG